MKKNIEKFKVRWYEWAIPYIGPAMYMNRNNNFLNAKYPIGTKIGIVGRALSLGIVTTFELNGIVEVVQRMPQITKTIEQLFS